MNIENLVLTKGSHKTSDDGMCVMEAVAYFNNEPHSDKPQCACPVLTSYLIVLNDDMNNEERQALKPYILRLIGTRDENSKKRMDILLHHTIVKIIPYALRLAYLEENAIEMEAVKSGDYAAAKAAAKSAESAAKAAAESAAKATAKAAAKVAAELAAWSAELAESAAWSAESAAKAAEAAESAESAELAESAAWAAAWAAAKAAAKAAESATWSARGVAESTRSQYCKMILEALDEALIEFR